MKNYYAILEVSRDATQDIIKSQYHFLLHAWHPDKFPNPEQKGRAQERTKELNEAYSILSKPDKRAEYDREFSTQTRSKGEQTTGAQKKKHEGTSRAENHARQTEGSWHRERQTPKPKEQTKVTPDSVSQTRVVNEKFIRRTTIVILLLVILVVGAFPGLFLRDIIGPQSSNIIALIGGVCAVVVGKKLLRIDKARW